MTIARKPVSKIEQLQKLSGDARNSQLVKLYNPAFKSLELGSYEPQPDFPGVKAAAIPPDVSKAWEIRANPISELHSAMGRSPIHQFELSRSSAFFLKFFQ